jgi:hypothetical protein
MKISERKQHLRARGVVPVPQATPQRSRKVRTPARARAADTRATDQKAPRRRWQPGPGYKMTFGLAYMIFSPFLFLNELALAHAPHAKAHPGAFEFLAPVVFFLFGAWWFVRGMQARRRQRAAATTLAPASKTQLAKGSPQ